MLTNIKESEQRTDIRSKQRQAQDKDGKLGTAIPKRWKEPS